MSDTPEEKAFDLPAGTKVEIDGTPYWLANDATVTGFEEPRFPVYPLFKDQSKEG